MQRAQGNKVCPMPLRESKHAPGSERGQILEESEPAYERAGGALDFCGGLRRFGGMCRGMPKGFGGGCVATMLAAGLLAACHSSQPDLLTGTHGGLLPGMSAPNGTNPATANGGAQVPAYVVQTGDERLPDGGVHRVQTLGGALFSEAWYRPDGSLERMVYDGPNARPTSLYEYNATGRLTRATIYYPGTELPQRIEEYDEKGNVIRFTTFWPTGRASLVSEVVVEEGIPLTRVREWYENGQQSSLLQRDANGRLEGHQMRWSEDGTVTFDSIYAADTLVHDNLEPPKEQAATP